MGSKIFEDFRPDYSAATVDRLLRAGGIMHLRTTTPEFAIFRQHPQSALGRYAQPVEPGLHPRRLLRRCGRGGRRRHDHACRRDGRRRIDPHPVVRLRYFRLQAALRPQSAGPRPSAGDDLALRPHGPERRRRRADAERHVRPASGRSVQPAEQDSAAATYDDIRGWKVAFSMNLGYFEVDPEVQANMRHAADVLRDLGCEVDEVDVGFNWGVQDCWMTWWEGLFCRDRGPPAAPLAVRDGPLRGQTAGEGHDPQRRAPLPVPGVPRLDVGAADSRSSSATTS